MKKILTLGACLAGMLFSSNVNAQGNGGLTEDEYKKALWMTTRMYGGQRSGEHNWYVYNIGDGKSFMTDKDGSVDLSGGWHDAGDFVKFGHTQFYAGYILLKGFSEFPEGYGDYYTYDYANYKGGNWNWEGNSHAPNNIPDILEEVKHATDFYIKSTPNASTFYYQVGLGNADHAVWQTSVTMSKLQSEAGALRPAFKNPADAAMPSNCGAALALMARVYKNYDAAYAQTCLEHAVYAYEYAKAHPGIAGTPEGAFYSGSANWKNDYANMLAELYWATKEEKYKTEALAFSIGVSSPEGQPATSDIHGNPWGFDYANTGELSLYNLALLGSAKADSCFKVRIAEILSSVDANGFYTKGNTSWGPLRYNANSSWLIALSQKLKKETDIVPKYIFDNIDWLLGKNSANQSFVVGFGSKSPSYPHHKNIYENDNGSPQNPGQISAKNKQSGLLVGGTRNLPYNDDPNNYQQSEGGIDYNAGLVGALGYINAVLYPVSQSNFKDFEQVEVPGSINAVSDVESFSKKIKLFPNPTVDNFTISSEYNLSVKIFNNVGYLVEDFKTVSGEKSFGEGLLPGVYHVNIYNGTTMVKSMNIVKNW